LIGALQVGSLQFAQKELLTLQHNTPPPEDASLYIVAKLKIPDGSFQLEGKLRFVEYEFNEEPISPN
jgi:hypothetical protein